MIINVLGAGCKNCKTLLERVKVSVKELNIDATINYITDMNAIVESGLIRTPGLQIDGKIVSYGKVLTVEEVTRILQS